MNENRRDKSAADPAVAERYRSIADERAPANLDRAVLGEAARELARDRWFGWFVPFFRPAAFAVTACLCVAVVLEINETSAPDVAADADTQNVVDGFTSAAAEGASRIREIGEAATEASQLNDTIGGGTGPRYCDGDDVATPESWWRCIQDLRASGRLAEAGAEARRLLEAYPNFRVQRD